MSHEHETAEHAASTSPTKLSLVGGAIGTALGSSRGAVGAVAGGLIGGTLGYLTGATLQGSAEDAPTVKPEPVSIDVADPDRTEGSAQIEIEEENRGDDEKQGDGESGDEKQGEGESGDEKQGDGEEEIGDDDSDR